MSTAPQAGLEGLPVSFQELNMLPDGKVKGIVYELRRRPGAAPAIASTYSRPDPETFGIEVLGHQPTEAARLHGITSPYTEDQRTFFRSIVENSRTAAPSCHGVGKTNGMVTAMLWWLYSGEDSIVVVTAPTWRQIRAPFWAEVSHQWQRSKTALPGEKLSMEIKIAPKWYATSISTSPDKSDLSSTKFQGHHGRRVMVIYEEATGIPPEIVAGAEGVVMNPDRDRFVAGGNPTDPTSWFKEACEARREDGSPLWNVVRFDAENHPNVVYNDPDIIPGAITRAWIDEHREIWGEDSPMYKAKVKGLWPDQAPDALISFAWVDAAQRRSEERDDAIAAGTYKSDKKGISAGLDVAGEGEDLTVLSFYQEGKVFLPKIPGIDSRGRPYRAWHVGRNPDDCVELMQAAFAAYPDIRILMIDDTGLGNSLRGTLQRMQREGKIPRFKAGGQGRSLWIIPAKFGGAPRKKADFHHLKDELWWYMREELRHGRLLLPTEKELAAYGLPKGNHLARQLMTPIYRDYGGKTVVYDKRGSRGGPDAAELTKTLPEKSPDLAHSAMMAVWGARYLKAVPDLPKPSTPEEWFAEVTRKASERARNKVAPRPQGKRGPRAPWVRRRG